MAEPLGYWEGLTSVEGDDELLPRNRRQYLSRRRPERDAPGEIRLLTLSPNQDTALVSY
jgi:hypothetical protein